MGVVTFEVRGRVRRPPDEDDEKPPEGRRGLAIILAGLVALSIVGRHWVSPRPPLELAFQPAFQDFGSQTLGSSTVQLFALTARVPAALGGFRLTGARPEEFDLEILTCTGETLPGERSCQTAVTFKPTREGESTAEIQVLNAVGQVAASATVRGAGVKPVVLRLDPVNHDFGTHGIGQTARQTFTLTSSGPVELGSLRLVDTRGALEFSLDQGTCNEGQMPDNLTCQFTVAFTPRQSGPRQVGVEVSTAAGDVTASTKLRGSGRVLPTQPFQPPLPTPVQPPVRPRSLLQFLMGGTLQSARNEPVVVKASFKNLGTEPLSISKVTLRPGVTIRLDPPAGRLAMVMEPGEERAFQLIFQPQRPGITKESLVIESNSISSPDRFEIRGIAGESPDPVASLVLERKAFEGGRIRAKAKLTNLGGGVLKPESAQLVDPNQEFAIKDGCRGKQLGHHKQCTIELTLLQDRFATNLAAGKMSVAELRVRHNAEGDAMMVKLRVPPNPPPPRKAPWWQRLNH